MGKKKIRYLLTIVSILILLTFSTNIHSKTFRVFGKNQLSYWQWSEDKRYFFENSLTLNAIYRNFRGNLEWFIYQPSNSSDALRNEGIRRRFIEAKYPEWSLRAGNFYQSFGNGLVLNQTLESTGNIDRDLNGLFFDYRYRFLSITLLSGRPKNWLFSNGKYSIANDTLDLIQGGSLNFSLFPPLPISLNAIRVSRENPGTEEPRLTYLYSLDVNLSYGPFIAYGEFARKSGWDQMLFTEDSTGRGIYGSVTFFVNNFSASFEYLNYDKLGCGGSTYRYNAPPTGNLDSYSINRARDETGWMFNATSNLFGNWYLTLNTSKLTTISSDSIGFDEYYGEVKGDIWNGGPTLILGLKNIIYKKPEPIIDKKTELIPKFELMIPLGSHSVNLGGHFRMVSIDTTKFMDNGVSLDIGLFSYLTIAGRWEVRNKNVPLESEGTEWKVAEIRWDISDAHTLNVMAGSEKGGLVCSGGVCREEEPFTGVKINLMSRF